MWAVAVTILTLSLYTHLRRKHTRTVGSQTTPFQCTVGTQTTEEDDMSVSSMSDPFDLEMDIDPSFFEM
jgi:hypothetical protein